MAWRRFVPETNRGAPPYARLSKGILWLSTRLTQAFGHQYVCLWYDAETGRIGLQPAEREDEGAKMVRHTRAVGSISVVGFRDYWQLPDPSYWRVDVTKDDGLLYVLSLHASGKDRRFGKKRRNG